MEEIISVLVFSENGACRGVMAGGWLQGLVEPIDVTVAAIQPQPVHPLAARVMVERDLPVSHLVPRSLSELRITGFGFVISIGTTAIDFCKPLPLFEGLPRDLRPLLVGDPIHLRWDIQAPHSKDEKSPVALEAFRQTRDLIEAHVRTLTDQDLLKSLHVCRQKTHHILDSLKEGIIVHDQYRSITMFNRAAENITGYLKEDILGTDCAMSILPHGPCGPHCVFAGQTEHTDQAVNFETPFTTKDGIDKQLRIELQPIRISTGQYFGTLLVMRDITELAEMRFKLSRRRGFHGMVGISPAIQDIFEQIRQVSRSDYPVHIQGESGSGKELVARAIHAESRRHGGAFIAINCGALPDTILESELFGHVRGAFTGAVREKKGRFELANGGTLFLDEVGDLSPAFQVKLLRVLQENRFEMLGGERTLEVDVRIISATNTNLRQLVEEGQFREDLYYRLCVVPIFMPRLADRKEDLPFLVDDILKTVRRETGKPIERLTSAAMECLLDYDWPGNVRELINTLQFSAVQCNQDEIDVPHLPPNLRPKRSTSRPHRSTTAPLSSHTHQYSRRRELTMDLVRKTLETTGGNRSKAARLLGIGRATLYRFLARQQDGSPSENDG